MNVESSIKKIWSTFVMPPPGFGKQCACANFYFDYVLQVLSSYQNSILFYCSGYDHDGEYAQYIAGIHHILVTFVGMIEAIDRNPFGQHTYMTTNLCFTGKVPNIYMDLKYPIANGDI